MGWLKNDLWMQRASWFERAWESVAILYRCDETQGGRRMINEREKQKLYELEKRQIQALEDIASELELLRIFVEQFLRKQRGGDQWEKNV